MEELMNKPVIRNIGIFVVAVIASGWIGVLVDSFLTGQPQGNSLGMGIWLVLPLLTALIIIVFSKITWKELGIRPNFRSNLKWYLASILIFPVVTAIVLSIGAITGWMDLSALNTRQFFMAFCGALLANLIIDFFEETAWRGYLTSQLLRLNLKDWKLYFLIGCIWGLWHVPYYLVFLPEGDIKSVMPVSRAVYTLVAFTTYLSWAVMFTELYRVTRSIWPCIMLHMVEDAFTNLMVVSGYISIAAGKEILVSPINGLITSALYVAVGLGIRAYRIRTTQIVSG